MIIAGIDAGGSKTGCILIDENGRVLARSETGAANIQTVGLGKAVNEIEKALNRAVEKVNINSVDLLGLGLAGAGRFPDIAKIEKSLSGLTVIKKYHISNDGEIALLAARGGDPGIVLVAGTGSIAYGMDKKGQTYRAGGWGPILGDEGSGFWIGLQSLKAVIKSREGQINNTALIEVIKEELEVKSLEELIDFTYRKQLPRKEIAKLAPAVMTAAESGDQAANNIIRKAVKELIITARTLMEKIKPDIKEITITGGLFRNDYFRKLFSWKLDEMTGCTAVKPCFDSEYGAALMAAREEEIKINLDCKL